MLCPYNTSIWRESPVTGKQSSEKALKENIEWLKSLQKEGESMGLSGEEVDGLGDLGDMLSSLEEELKLELLESNSITDVNNAQDSEKTEKKPEE